MKLLRLSVATLLVASTFTAGRGNSNTGDSIVGINGPPTLKDFVTDPQIQSVAPHLIQQITTRVGQDSSSLASLLSSSLYHDDSVNNNNNNNFPASKRFPLLNDLIEIVAQIVFSPKSKEGKEGWSRLEAAKLRALQNHGEEAVAAAATLTAMDTHRAILIVRTIYDTVLHMPTSNKGSYLTNIQPSTSKRPFSFWDWLGFGLIKSSDMIKGINSVVASLDGMAPEGCETQDTAYLKGVQEVVYYSSLTDGLAGSTMVTMAPTTGSATNTGSSSSNAAVINKAKSSLSLGWGTILVEIHMAQSVARLADLNPLDDHVRVMILLALAAGSVQSEDAQVARDMFVMKSLGFANRVPDTVLKALEQKAAAVLITKGAGRGTGSGAGANDGGLLGQSPVPNVPVLKNLFTFSRDVLSANQLGETLKFVFCPGQPNEPLDPVNEDNGLDTAVTKAREEEEDKEQAMSGDDDEEKEYDEDDDEDEDENEEAQENEATTDAKDRPAGVEQKAFSRFINAAC
ncbi:MAG: hypothetical protein J3Q66DRAFT_363274 [Benniella sp.]|nr:MAG: hypothetical protein J3Q66DRAFT_363274 [Benniella sp.]